MSEEDNKAVVRRWFTEFWGNPWNPAVVDELAAPDIRFEYSMHAPRRGRDEVKQFAEGFRAAFPDLNFWGTAELIAEGDYVVGRWEGGGTHTGSAFSDLPVGSLPAQTGKAMRFTGTTVLKVENGRITEELGLDDGVTAFTQLGLIGAPRIDEVDGVDGVDGVDNVDDAPEPDSADFLAHQNPVEKVSPGTTADSPAVTPGLISTDPALSDKH